MSEDYIRGIILGFFSGVVSSILSGMIGVVLLSFLKERDR